jgi:hypothetical protein
MENAVLRDVKVLVETELARLAVCDSDMQRRRFDPLQAKDVAQDARLGSLQENLAALQV